MKNKDGFHVTPWFPGEAKPVRVGVYERKFGGWNFYCRWDGKNWHFGKTALKDANNYRSWMSGLPDQEVPWRGITKKEYKKAKKENQ